MPANWHHGNADSGIGAEGHHVIEVGSRGISVASAEEAANGTSETAGMAAEPGSKVSDSQTQRLREGREAEKKRMAAVGLKIHKIG